MHAKGIDISGHNGAFKKDPDAFRKVKAAGYSFVYIKATQGASYTFKLLRDYSMRCEDAELDFTFYHFDVPRKGASAVNDAQYFLNAVHGIPHTMRLVNDHEEAYQLKRLGGMPDKRFKLPAPVLVEWADAFADTIQKALGYVPVFYTYADYLVSRRKAFLAAQAVQHGPFWCAKVGKVQPKDCSPWPTWACWQHSWATKIPGLSGVVDANVTRDLAALRLPTRCC